MQLRGPGDILGKRQSGLPSFILGDLIQDSNIINQARIDAIEIINEFDKYSNIKDICNKYVEQNKYYD